MYYKGNAMEECEQREGESHTHDEILKYARTVPKIGTRTALSVTSDKLLGHEVFEPSWELVQGDDFAGPCGERVAREEEANCAARCRLFKCEQKGVDKYLAGAGKFIELRESSVCDTLRTSVVHHSSGRDMGVLSMMEEGILPWHGGRSWADLVLGEVGGSFISVVGEYFFGITVQRLAKKGLRARRGVVTVELGLVDHRGLASCFFILRISSSLAFLDILITRQNCRYITNVYYKPSFYPSYIHYTSYCPLSHKINTVKTLSKRIFTHCSSQEFKQIETQNVIGHLMNSGYPKDFILRHFYNPQQHLNSQVYRSICTIPFSTHNPTFISDLDNIPYIYGLPKTHKPGIPLRPIIAYHLSPAYKLSKYLTGYLTPWVKASPQSSAIRDIPSFVQSINSLCPVPNTVMASYDVVAMYLSLPHQLIISHLTKFLQDNQVYPRTAESIVALSSLCLDFTTLTFNNLLFKQIRGSPMGSPLSSPLAEIVMANIDHWVQQQIAPGIHMWRRYIDDIFCICDTGQEISILDSLNSYHPEISFTLELEDRSVLPYLDILVIRTTSHYHTTVNNPTFYTDFKSSCPLSHKINTVRTLTKRLFTHCSLPLFRTIEFSLIIKQLARSQYPPISYISINLTLLPLDLLQLPETVVYFPSPPNQSPSPASSERTGLTPILLIAIVSAPSSDTLSPDYLDLPLLGPLVARFTQSLVTIAVHLT
ncbi:hypothetical protein LAZ67_8000961 [Cordylochernes scorpioides]|uniref:Reverse transcriptase domain-containing protein n=1 Tax=Cordylochernes scorpioides TaxID=51811 RepID=A0ABY6KPW6_9ARAC|nr:hypothetical protein LAZ67_8000961 [Cordylochernes scorpioides]